MFNSSKFEKLGIWIVLLITAIFIHALLNFIGTYDEFISGHWSRIFILTQLAHIIILVIGGMATIMLILLNNKLSKEKSVERVKNDFLSLAAHQLRTPLSAIKWLIEFLMEDSGSLMAKQKEMLENIYRSNERLIFIVNDLLNISKIESPNFSLILKPVIITKIIQKVVENLENEANKRNVKIELHLEELSERLLLDEFKFDGSFKNILENAIYYCYPASTIVVKGNIKGENYIIMVHNFGPPIPGEDQKYIFKKFYRGEIAKKLKTTGTGLGLFIAKKIIEANNGKIWFESSEKKGTTFFISLPIIKDKLK